MPGRAFLLRPDIMFISTSRAGPKGIFPATRMGRTVATLLTRSATQRVADEIDWLLMRIDQLSVWEQREFKHGFVHVECPCKIRVIFDDVSLTPFAVLEAYVSKSNAARFLERIASPVLLGQCKAAHLTIRIFR